MRILVIEPERRPEVREINDSLDTMQELIGGLIQPIYPFDDPVALVCNDEGKLMDLPANRRLRDERGQIYDIVCGIFFLCGAPTDTDHCQIGDNQYLAEVNDVRCTAIFNFFTGAYYVDDVYGIVKDSV